MDRRTYEGHMDWEYEKARPLDPTSPFAQAARSNPQAGSIFATPSKSTSRPNVFSNLASPSKPHVSPPKSSTFHTPLRSQPSAPPFRNPAFTTPRRPFDEPNLSEASGAEDSPAVTEVSDYPNETPDIDKFNDLTMGGTATITPSKVDKTMRYGRTVPSSRKHAPGKGEIRGHGRGISTTDVSRKRRRHIYDRDVGSSTSYQRHDWDGSDSDSQDSASQSGKGRSRNRKPSRQNGFFRSMFATMNDHPNAPENLTRWALFGFNSTLFFICAWFLWGFVASIQSDVNNANQAARMEIISKITECQNQYTLNRCSNEDTPPYVRDKCAEWHECFMQNPESIMRMKVSAKQIAEIINEFSDTMSIKGWAFIVVIILAFAAGNTKLRMAPSKTASDTNRLANHEPHEPNMNADRPPAYVYMLPTPMRGQRHAMLDDGTDTDASPPTMRSLLPQQSPSKRERSLSPTKLRMSPKKFY